MPKKRFSGEQIVVLLRQIEVLMSQGKAAPVAYREAGIIAAELRDECLNQEIFHNLKEAQVVSAHTHQSDIDRRRGRRPKAPLPSPFSHMAWSKKTRSLFQAAL